MIPTLANYVRFCLNISASLGVCPPHRFRRGDSIRDGGDSRGSLAVTVSAAIPFTTSRGVHMQKWIAFYTNDGADGSDESEWGIFEIVNVSVTVEGE